MFSLLTFIGQMIAFAVFVAACVYFIWPPLINAMRERQQRIAEGLENAEKAEQALENSNEEASQILRDAREEGQRIIQQARSQTATMIEEARTEARSEAERIVEAAQAEVEQEANRVREELRGDLAELAVVGAERILGGTIDRNQHAQMLEELAQDL